MLWTWRRTLKRLTWAFSTSSKRTTVYGLCWMASISWPPLSNIARLGSNNHGMLFHIFRHVNPDHIFLCVKKLMPELWRVLFFPHRSDPGKGNFQGVGEHMPIRAHKIACATASTASSWPTTHYVWSCSPNANICWRSFCVISIFSFNNLFNSGTAPLRSATGKYHDVVRPPQFVGYILPIFTSVG